MKDDELEHERKMQEAMEKIQKANEFRQVSYSHEIKVIQYAMFIQGTNYCGPCSRSSD